MFSHSFMLPDGKRLTFENPDGLYPINAYQSEVFAQAAVNVAYVVAAERACSTLRSLKAKEICVGNGPAAIALKAIGVGTVEATDINPDALVVAQNNAMLNGIALDRIEKEDIRNPDSRWDYDLIAVNPPCARASVKPGRSSAAIQAAVDGGMDGTDYFEDAVRAGYLQLKNDGWLVIGLTSAMDIPAALEGLSHYFGADWYVASGTPHAAPFASLNPETPGGAIGSTDRGTREIQYSRENGRSMVWDGGDGNAWRNTWFIVAHKITHSQVPLNKKIPELPLKPYGWPDDLAPQDFKVAAMRLQMTLQRHGLA